MANKSKCTNKTGKNTSLLQHPIAGNNTNTNIDNSKNVVDSIAVNKQATEMNNNYDQSNDNSASILKANKNNNNSNNLFINLPNNLEENKNNKGKFTDTEGEEEIEEKELSKTKSPILL